MRVIELFAGIGACSTALKRIGMDVEIVDAVEIDKYAIASFNAIHGTNFGTQDIKEWDKDFRDIDLITHGSPCQDFSVAGKQAGGDIGSGTRSSLMYETIRIVGKLRPKYVLWENVKNILSKTHKHNFDAYVETMKNLGYNSFYEVLNAKDYGIPQNRERVYTISIRNDISKSFAFPEKEVLLLKLKDMLEDNVDEKYYLAKHLQDSYNEKTGRIEGIKFNCRNKINDIDGISETLCAAMGMGGNTQPKIIDTNKKCIQIGTLDIKGIDQIKRVYSTQGISPTLTTMGGGNREPKIIEEVARNTSFTIVGESVKPSVAKNFEREKEQIVNSDKEIYQCECEGGWQDNKVGLKVSPTLRANNNNTFAYTGVKIRKLTPKECWRLMGFRDADFQKAQSVPMSNTQLYKQAGNSIVVNVLEKIFRNLFKNS